MTNQQETIKLTKRDLLRMADDVTTVMEYLQVVVHALNLVPSIYRVKEDEIKMHYNSLEQLAEDNHHNYQKMIEKLDRVATLLLDPEDHQSIEYVRNEEY